MVWKCLLCIALINLFSPLAFAQDRPHEVGVVWTYTFLKEIGTRDAGVGTEAAGMGGRFTYRIKPFLHLETEMNVLPGNSATSGNRVQGLFGAKMGVQWKKVGFFVKARPGFLHFRRDPFGVGVPSGTNFFSRERAKSTEPTLDIGGVIEYLTEGGVTVRFDLGDSMVRYAPRTVRTSDFVPPFQAGGFSTHNWQGSFGVGIRF
jgi:hypothetical protein